MKKAISLILTLAMVLSLCACGGGNDTKTPDSADNSSSSSQIKSEEEAPQESDVQEPEVQEPEVPEKVTSTNYMNIDGIYVDTSYQDSDNDKLKLVYLFYTVSTNNENLAVASTTAKMTINGVNTYTAALYNKSCTYMSSYYYSQYLETVYVGDSLKVVETFKIPEGDLAEGRTLTLSKTEIPEIDQIQMTTDDIVFCDSAEEIAQLVDPDGYADELYRRSDADESTASAVKEAINGYYWTFYVNSIIYKIEFFSPNGFELTVSSLNVSNEGTYSVKNGYVVCTYTESGTVVEIPYTWEDNDINLDVVSAFDVKAG